jgi:hypothetical protein
MVSLGCSANRVMLAEAKTAESVFTRNRCSRFYLKFRVPKEEFRREQFEAYVEKAMEAVSGTSKKKRKRIDGVVCSSRLEQFHVHLDWSEKEAKLFEMIAYFHPSFRDPDEGEQEPFAEDIIKWLASYFVNKAVDAEVRAEFKIPTGERKSKLLLNLATKLDTGVEIEIDGMSMSIPSKPSGIEKLWINQAEGQYLLQLQGKRQVDFVSFDLNQEITEVSRTTEIVLEKV